MTYRMYIVVDSAFNRENYPDMIGRSFFTPPGYAQVKLEEKPAK